MRSQVSMVDTSPSAATSAAPLPETASSPRRLRSARWFESADMRGFSHRLRTQQLGLRREEFLGRPVVAIINTWSEMSPCHIHLRQRAEAVKRGVLLRGGFPVVLFVLSVGEVMVLLLSLFFWFFL